MSVSQQQGYANFNLYDIFANFLPGAIFMTGILFPYVGISGLFTELKAGGLLLMVVLSFAAGLFVQAVGGNVQSSGQDFADHIQKVDRGDNEESEIEEYPESESEINISPLDAYFVEAFRVELGLDSDFEDWSRLHKLILAKLEATSRSRALRLQALYLAMRGMSVTAGFLSIWYILYMVLVLIEVFSTPLPTWSLLYVACLSFGTAGKFYERSEEFSKDVAKYMIIEYYLEVLAQQDRTIELDFLDKENEEADKERNSGSEPSPKDAEEQFAKAANHLSKSTGGETMESDTEGENRL